MIGTFGGVSDVARASRHAWRSLLPWPRSLGGAAGAMAPPQTAAGEDGLRARRGRRSPTGVASYKGIPFAAPPVGDLRWRAPQPPKAWTALCVADKYAHDCMQNPFPSDAAPLGTPPDEDCLYLNVWTPEKPGKTPLPVMVWIYGGGFVNGGSSPAVYDGSHFARRGIVFVSMNYRLGRFGFFAHPALTQENPKGPLGNYAFLDQIAALQWVQAERRGLRRRPRQRHDLRRVRGRRLGQHAHDLAAREGPLPQGDRRVGRRPRPRHHLDAATSATRRPGGPPSAEAVGVVFAEKAGVKGEGPALLTALRDLPAAAVVGGMNLIEPAARHLRGPDGRRADRALGGRARVPRGPAGQGPLHDRREQPRVRLLPLPPERTDAMFAAFGDDKEKALAAYDPEGKGDKGDVGVGLMSDQAMVEPARLLARLAAKTPAHVELPLLLRGVLAAREPEGRAPRDRDPVRVRDRARQVRGRDHARGRGHGRGHERLLGRVRPQRRPERRRACEVAGLHARDDAHGLRGPGPRPRPTRGGRGSTSSRALRRRRWPVSQR